MSDDHASDGPGQPGQPPRNLAALAYSGIVVAGLAAMTLAGVAGTADAAPRIAPLKPLTSTAGTGTPPHSTRTTSRKLARRLIGEVELPPGAVQQHFTKLPKVLRHVGGSTASYHKVNVVRFYWDPRGLDRAYAFMSSHHPKGWTLYDSGSAYEKKHGKKIYFEKDVTWAPRHLPAADDDVEMQIDVVPHHGHTWIKVGLQVIWYPRRSAAEHLIASHLRSVTARAYRYNEKPHHIRRTFRQRAIIDRLASVLNSTEASPGTPFINCPLIDVTYVLTFQPKGHQKDVKIQIDGCYSMGVVVGGHDQPALVDDYKIEPIIDHLLRIHPFLAPSHPIHHEPVR